MHGISLHVTLHTLQNGRSGTPIRSGREEKGRFGERQIEQRDVSFRRKASQGPQFVSRFAQKPDRQRDYFWMGDVHMLIRD